MSIVKALFLTADPEDAEQLRIDEEIRSIQQKLLGAAGRDSLELVYALAARPDDLLLALHHHKPHILHFSGHGSGRGEVLLIQDDQRSKPVRAELMASLLRTLKGNLRLVVFNCCYSQRQAEAAAEVVGCAVGTPAGLKDDHAVRFAAAFYRALAFGVSVQEAFEQGRLALRLENEDVPDEHLPRLVVSPHVDPSRLYPVAPAEPSIEHYLRVDLPLSCDDWFRPNELFELHPRDQFVPISARWHGTGGAADAVEEILRKLGEDRRARLAVSANYGQGKTFLAWRLALELAARDDRTHIPFFFPLRSYSPNAVESLFQQVRSYIQSRYGDLDVEELFGERDCLLILDAMDEMPAGPASTNIMVGLLEEMLRSLARFGRLALLVTFRSGLFPKGLEQFQECFPDFEPATLDLWERQSWESLLERCETTKLVRFAKGWQSFRDEVARRPLVDLTTRPLWCRMMLETRETILQADIQGEADLYGFYVDDYFRRGRIKSRSQILTTPQKLQIIELLAAEMARIGLPSDLGSRRYVTDDLLAAAVAQKLSTIPDSDFMEFLLHDLRTYSLIHCQTFYRAERSRFMAYYTFGHVSFEHFFQARGFARALDAELEPDQDRARPSEHLPYLAALVDSSESVSGFLVGMLRRHGRASENLGLILRKDPKVFLAGISGELLLRRSLLKTWLAYSRKVQGRKTVDLSGFRLDRLDLSRMDLSHCSFVHAVLNGAVLRHCDLTGSDLSHAKCRNADFTQARLAGARLETADLRGALGLPVSG